MPATHPTIASLSVWVFRTNGLGARRSSVAHWVFYGLSRVFTTARDGKSTPANRNLGASQAVGNYYYIIKTVTGSVQRQYIRALGHSSDRFARACLYGFLQLVFLQDSTTVLYYCVHRSHNFFGTTSFLPVLVPFCD